MHAMYLITPIKNGTFSHSQCRFDHLDETCRCSLAAVCQLHKIPAGHRSCKTAPELEAALGPVSTGLYSKSGAAGCAMQQQQLRSGRLRGRTWPRPLTTCRSRVIFTIVQPSSTIFSVPQCARISGQRAIGD